MSNLMKFHKAVKRVELLKQSMEAEDREIQVCNGYDIGGFEVHIYDHIEKAHTLLSGEVKRVHPTHFIDDVPQSPQVGPLEYKVVRTQAYLQFMYDGVKYFQLVPIRTSFTGVDDFYEERLEQDEQIMYDRGEVL